MCLWCVCVCMHKRARACTHVHGEEWGWCRIINTVRVKEHSPELAGGCGRSTQSLGSRVQGRGFKTGLEAEVSLSAQEAEEIGGAWGWAHEHGHLVSVSDLDLEGKGACSEAVRRALALEPGDLGEDL